AALPLPAPYGACARATAARSGGAALLSWQLLPSRPRAGRCRTCDSGSERRSCAARVAAPSFPAQGGALSHVRQRLAADVADLGLVLQPWTVCGQTLVRPPLEALLDE